MCHDVNRAACIMQNRKLERSRNPDLSKNNYKEVVIGSGNITSLSNTNHYMSSNSCRFTFDVKIKRTVKINELSFYAYAENKI